LEALKYIAIASTHARGSVTYACQADPEEAVPILTS
jgi:hypothetical protein